MKKKLYIVFGIVLCLVVAWHMGTKPSSKVVYTPAQTEAQLTVSEGKEKTQSLALSEQGVAKGEVIDKATDKGINKDLDVKINPESQKQSEEPKSEEQALPGQVLTEQSSPAEDEIKQKEEVKKEEPKQTEETKQKEEVKQKETKEEIKKLEEAKGDKATADALKKEIVEEQSKVKKDKYMTEPTPEGKPKPVEPQDVVVNKKESFKVQLSISCETILNNMDLLDEAKYELVPADGIIYSLKEVEAYAGESVFDVLLREVKKEKIHMEFSFTPMYNSVYIEGINNLYEFDTGELSGWMYKVNEWFPNYGASRYQVKEGDIIEWVYTCDLGRDVGEIYIPPK